MTRQDIIAAIATEQVNVVLDTDDYDTLYTWLQPLFIKELEKLSNGVLIEQYAEMFGDGHDMTGLDLDSSTDADADA